MSRHLGMNAVSAFIAIAFVAPLAWMLMDREPPYTFVGTEISPAYVREGGEIEITFTVKENRPACGPGMIYREFKEEVSGKIHTIDPVTRAAPPVIVNNKFTRIAKLPENITPGLVTYRGMACYTCNPVHSWLRWPVCTNTPTAQFEILPSK